MKLFPRLLRCLLLCALSCSAGAHAAKLQVAAAADLKFAMDEIIAAYEKQQPGLQVDVSYGSSGKFHAQIKQGAPFDVYFSADIAYARDLHAQGFAASTVQTYAFGRLVIWSRQPDAAQLQLPDLAQARFVRIAIANPKHAPYGQRAEAALRSLGLWDKVQSKLVYGENIAHAAQFVQSGNAQAGILALALAKSPALAAQGGYSLIPQNLHPPLEQGFILTKRAADNPAAKQFAAFILQETARGILEKYGFLLPPPGKAGP
ncbi:molybdate ABC transporter substrate-binding protein [Massilia sp. W12]|uniref:molybdate ABC transporter substrate-binding protein n=1 Tax=Massilia sp. W12 TaxID=3126507 RepID=UPI0030D56829